MKLQTSSRLAIFAVLELARDPEIQKSVHDIGQKYGVSPHHLAKVMKTLNRAGLVQATRGVGGGYRFTGNARRVTLRDVVALFEDVLYATAANTDAADETEAGRALRSVLVEIDDITNATLGATTLATMLKLMGHEPPGEERAAAAASLRRTGS